MLAGEGLLTGVIGAGCALVLGGALSIVLVYVVNRQSFLWSIDLAVPWAQLGLLTAVLVAATSGISAIVAPDGTIEQQLPEFVAGHLVAKVPLRDTLTVADRLGALPVLVAVAGALGLLAVVLVRSRRRRDVGFMESRPSEESLP